MRWIPLLTINTQLFTQRKTHACPPTHTHAHRIRYVPHLDSAELSKPNFMVSPYLMHFFENADYSRGGMADWTEGGLGVLHVYCQDIENEPVLAVPINLASTMRLNRGRAWVGFTAATGEDTWQVHDILNWKFSSLREDSEYISPTLINGNGAYASRAGTS